MKRDKSRSETDFGVSGSLWGSGGNPKPRGSWGFSGLRRPISLIRIEMLAGQVQPGPNYVLVDDHVGLDGTLANLHVYIEARGGEFIAITTLTESRDARIILLQPAIRIVLRHRHGPELDDPWQSQFGYGIDCLTEVEALNLGRQHSVAAIEDFLVQAAVEARGRGLQTAVEPGY